MTRRTALASLAFAFAAAPFFTACRSKSSRPQAPPAAQPLTDDGAMRPTDKDHCAMCGMTVLEHPDWVGAIQLQDGATYYLCSVNCTLATANHPEKFLGVDPSRIRRVRVPDYLHSKASLDAQSALYVVDSDVRGPMGLTLVPAVSRTDAETIVQRHGGYIVQRQEVTDALLMGLKQRNRTPTISPAASGS